MRTRNKPWAFEVLKQNKSFVLSPEQYKGKWNQYFKNGNPIHIEIGCGKGNFIINTAKKNKNINHIAIEKSKNVLVTGVRNFKDIDSSLVFVLGFAQNLNDYFQKGEISRIYLNFCDPWENRKKWEKRRLTHNTFLSLYENLIDCDGEIFLKTDNSQLFEFSLNQFVDNDWKLKNISFDLYNSGLENIMTEYEEKFVQRGIPIYRCEAAKYLTKKA